jgi:hypothetical protein
MYSTFEKANTVLQTIPRRGLNRCLSTINRIKNFKHATVPKIYKDVNKEI